MSSNQGQVRVCLIYTGLGLEVARYCCHTSCSAWTEVHIDHTEYMHIYSVNGMIQESRIISTSIREFVSGSTGLGIQGRHQDLLMSHPLRTPMGSGFNVKANGPTSRSTRV